MGTVGEAPGASLAWLPRGSARRRLRPRRSSASIGREINGLRPQERLCPRQERSRPLIIERRLGCANSVPGSLRTATRQKRSTTVSTAGTPSPASSMMGAFVCRTTRRNASCGPLLSGERTGLRRLRRRRPARRCDLHADRHSQAQRCQYAGLTRRRAGPLARSLRQTHSQTPALELAPAKRRRRRCLRIIGRFIQNRSALWPSPDAYRLTDRPRLKNGRLSRAPKVSSEARYKLKEPERQGQGREDGQARR